MRLLRALPHFLISFNLTGGQSRLVPNGNRFKKRSLLFPFSSGIQ